MEFRKFKTGNYMTETISLEIVTLTFTKAHILLFKIKHKI